MRNLGKMLLVLVLLVIGFLVTILQVKIILSIATLYGLHFITSFSFVQLFGVFYILNILKVGIKKEDLEAYENGGFLSSTTSLLAKSVSLRLVSFLIIWGVAFLMFPILS